MSASNKLSLCRPTTYRFPDSLEDYDASLHTITFEIWMMNRVKRDCEDSYCKYSQLPIKCYHT
jgi:hypothetical protein